MIDGTFVVAAMLLFCAGLSVVGCGEKPVPGVGPDTSVTLQSDGSLDFRPRITDVAVLELQRDGTYLRKCGPASPEIRARMTEKMAERMADMRARRGAP